MLWPRWNTFVMVSIAAGQLLQIDDHLPALKTETGLKRKDLKKGYIIGRNKSQKKGFIQNEEYDFYVFKDATANKQLNNLKSETLNFTFEKYNSHLRVEFHLKYQSPDIDAMTTGLVKTVFETANGLKISIVDGNSKMNTHAELMLTLETEDNVDKIFIYSIQELSETNYYLFIVSIQFIGSTTGSLLFIANAGEEGNADSLAKDITLNQNSCMPSCKWNEQIVLETGNLYTNISVWLQVYQNKGIILRRQFANDYKFLPHVVRKRSNTVHVEAADKCVSNVSNLRRSEDRIRFDAFCSFISSDLSTYRIQALDNETKLQLLDIANATDYDRWRMLLNKVGFSKITVQSACKFKVDERKIKKIIDITMRFINLPPLNTSMESGVIKIIGNYLIMSYFKEQLHGNDSIQDIVLIGTKKIFIDCDLFLLNKHLTIVSPVIETVEVARKIVMKGEDAPPLEETKARVNTKAKKGRNGYSSGQLKIVSLNIENPHLLELTSIGGDGSAGQDAGGSDMVPSVAAHNETLIGPPLSLMAKLKGNSSEIEVKLFKNLNPTSIEIEVTMKSPIFGLNGGDGGAGADAGFQILIVQNESSIAYVKKTQISGKAGLGGNGGSPSKSISKGIRRYECLAHYGFFKLVQFYSCNPGNSITYVKNISSSIPQSVCKQGQQDFSHSINYTMLPKYGIFDVINDFNHITVSISWSLFSSTSSDASEFLDFFLTANKIVTLLTLEDYSHFLTMVNSYMQQSNHRGSVQVIYQTMYRSFKKFALKCENCDTLRLEEVDLLFVSQLNYLQALSIGNYYPSWRDSAKSLRFSLIEPIIKNIGIFDTVNEDIQKARVQVESIKNLIGIEQSMHINQLREDTDSKFSKVLNETKNMQAQSKDQTEESTLTIKVALSDVIVRKALISTVNLFTIFAGWFFHSVAAILYEIGIFLSPMDDADLAAMVAKYPKDCENTWMELAQYKEHKVQNDKLRGIELVKALKAVMDAETSTGEMIFINEEQRKTAKIFVDEYMDILADQNAYSIVDFYVISDIIESLDTRLADKSKELEAPTSTMEHNTYESARGKLKFAQQVAISSTAVKDLVSVYGKDEANLNIIIAIIESNEDVLQEIGRYEQALESKFLPTLEGMLATVIGIAKGNTSMIIKLREMNTKELARSFVTLMSQFSSAFADDVNDDISIFLENLQKYFALLINSDDKLNGLEYRVRLKDFIEQTYEGTCSNVSDTCLRNQELAKQIIVDEMVRNCILIFDSFQRYFFPDGDGFTESYRDMFTRLKGSSNESINDMLRSFLYKIIYSDALSRRPSHGHDCDMWFAPSETFGPLYIWKNSNYYVKIKKLLSGEKISLSVSAFKSWIGNVVMFDESILLNVTSENPIVARDVSELLSHFSIKMEHLGESHYRCGDNFYVIGSDPKVYVNQYPKVESLNLYWYYKLDAKHNSMLSPYTVWNFQLQHDSSAEKLKLLSELGSYADSVNLELVGIASAIIKKELRCNCTYANKYYQYFNGKVGFE